jgi:REP element-mobilizing transposase RayT
MPRPLRVEFAGACYHVINRGNYRRALFEGKGAAEAFERVLGEAARRFSWQVHAYVIMSTHFHLAVETAEPNLSESMKWLQGTWIRRYNRFRGLVGRPFQGRYKALLVAPGHALAQVCHYIHLNPVRARLLPPAEVGAYAWSSLPKFAGRNRPAWLAPGTVLLDSGDLQDTASGWKRYFEYLEFLATDNLARKELAAERMSRGWCLGDARFKAEMKVAAAEAGADLERFEGLEPDSVRQERADAWEERLHALARIARIDIDSLPAPKSHPSKAKLAAAMKASCSVSNAWLAQRLAMGEPASASQFARRWMLETNRKADVEALLSRVKT